MHRQATVHVLPASMVSSARTNVPRPAVMTGARSMRANVTSVTMAIGEVYAVITALKHVLGNSVKYRRVIVSLVKMVDTGIFVNTNVHITVELKVATKPLVTALTANPIGMDKAASSVVSVYVKTGNVTKPMGYA